MLPAPGDLVWIRQSRWRVERVAREADIVRLDVRRAHERRSFLTPFDQPARLRPRTHPRYIRRQRGLSRLAGLVARAYSVRTIASATTVDAVLLPHQLEPALAALAGARRILIADDVGLGKTIQAGFVIAETMRRSIHARVLVIVPAALRPQWAQELSRRFDLESRSAGAGELERASRDRVRGQSPWLQPGLWIASIDYLKQPHVFDALPRHPWDLLVVDEAHHACGESARHACCDAIAKRSRQVLLLSATPHNGDSARFDRLLATGRLATEDDPMTMFRRTRADLGLPHRRRMRWHHVRMTSGERRLLDALVAFEGAVLAGASEDKRDAALLVLSVFRKRALSTTAALVSSIDRRLRWIEGREPEDRPSEQARLDFGDPEDEIADDDQRALRAEIGMGRGRERSWLRRLRALTEGARERESKIARLTTMLRRSTEPVVVFTEFRDSLAAIYKRVCGSRAVAVLHGGLTAGDQQKELTRFLSGAASVLLATDVAGQGLNLQARARWVISFELPWNPARIEQRAGRVDRIGQTRFVHVTLLVARHPAESGVLAGLIRRTQAARRTFGSEMFAAFAPDTTHISAHVLAGTPLTEFPPQEPEIPVCERWRRVAARLARDLARRKHLLAFDRGPQVDARAPAVVRGRALSRLMPADRTLALFSVPILDGRGEVIERHVKAIDLPQSPDDSPRQLSHAALLAAHHLQPRLARLRRLISKQRQDRIRRETAIARELARAMPIERQPGLFDRREARVFDALTRTNAEVELQLERQLTNFDAAGAISIGTPVLELIFS